MDQIATQTDYEFAGFRLNTALQVLIPPEGEPQPLSSRVFQTLLVLIQHAGETVDKRYLLRSVWPDVVVEENNVNQSIAALRRALGESAGDRKFILTVPGRGFRFIAPVKAVLPGATFAAIDAPAVQLELQAASPNTPAKAEESSKKGLARPWAPILAGLTLAAFCVVATVYLEQRPVTRPGEYEQLTDDFESAGAPALSADGRFLAYVRGGGQFASRGQIYVKALPSGEPMRLTNVDAPIYAPAFSPDGAQLTFTMLAPSSEPRDWSTWAVPVTGGEPSLFLPNASGLTWLAPDRLMYSEVTSGIRMGIVTSTVSRADRHEVYFPVHERGMAHFSFVSPDRRHVIVAEMNGAGNFEQCRLVPMDGGSPGKLVGPPSGCMSAAWSPDGRWMYFAAAAEVEGQSHLWRARFPDGEAEQITFGPTEEMAVIVTPDGHSLISSIGTDKSSIWLHAPGTETQLTTERLDYSPWLSSDGKRLYYLRSGQPHSAAQLMRLHIPEQRTEILLPDFDVRTYDIAPDERTVVFATMRNGESQVWVATMDRQSSPKLLARAADRPFFAGSGQICFRQSSDRKNLLRRINMDGGQVASVLNSPILDVFGVSRDGTWVSVGVEVDHHAYSRVYNTRTGELWWSRVGFGPVRWSADGKLLYVQASRGDNVTTDVLPFDAAGPPADPDASSVQLQQIPSDVFNFAAASDPSTYVLVKYERHRNIFRIPLH